MKKALITASFGTTHEDTRIATIERIKRELEDKFEDYDSFEIFTSKIIRTELERRGERVAGPEEILEKLYPEYKEVLIVSTHLLDGIEYAKLRRTLENYSNYFSSLILTEPILKNQEDLREMAEFLKDEFSIEMNNPDTFILLMGHGTKGAGGEVYKKLNKELDDIPMMIACVEGEPSFEEAIESIRHLSTTKVVLAPFMVVAGEHAKVDLIGEESWKSQLIKHGYQVKVVMRGLGEYPWFRKFLVERIQ